MLLACYSTASVVSCYSSSCIQFYSPKLSDDPVGIYDAWQALAWSCVGFCPDLHLATGILSYSRWQVCTRWLCLFYVKSTVGPPRPRFCSLYYSIKSYVRYWCTTACCRRVVLLLHTTPYEMLRLLLASLLPESPRSSRYYCSLLQFYPFAINVAVVVLVVCFSYIIHRAMA